MLDSDMEVLLQNQDQANGDLMPEANAGQLYHTQDGKTVFIDPKTKQATVFEGIKTIEQILEPDQTANFTGGSVDPMMLPIISKLIGGMQLLHAPLKMGFVIVKGPKGESEEEVDILGPKQYYVLANKSVVPLSVGSTCVRAWVSEQQNGHKPDYPGYEKHRILPEQWDWLMQHKSCAESSAIRAWYDQEQPGFLALGCQNHGKIMKPISKVDGAIDSKDTSFAVESSSVAIQAETVSAEEREI